VKEGRKHGSPRGDKETEMKMEEISLKKVLFSVEGSRNEKKRIRITTSIA